jgi:SAM-dependent methyltransferase
MIPIADPAAPAAPVTPATQAFRWPTPPGAEGQPEWTGAGFRVGGASLPLLSFAGSTSGWSDELTEFHEAEAGSGEHPIDVASRGRAVEALARRNPSAGSVILEVGCSSGFLLRELREAFPQALVVGADYVRGPLQRLAETSPGTPLLHFDLTACPLADASVDAIVALNVLEHIPDDGAAIRQMRRILRPGGVAVIEVPAGPELFDVYDKMLMHHRRYSMRGLLAAFRGAGFRIEERSHLGFLVYPAFAVVKHRNKRYLREPEDRQRAIVASSIRSTGSSPVMRLAMAVEAALGRVVRYPVGIRCVLTAVKD